jgi:hypothetical protein
MAWQLKAVYSIQKHLRINAGIGSNAEIIHPLTHSLQVSQEQSPDVLVIMGAQHSAQKRYREALYCLDRALQLDPSHIRGHYSRGQVGRERWPCRTGSATCL